MLFAGEFVVLSPLWMSLWPSSGACAGLATSHTFFLLAVEIVLYLPTSDNRRIGP